MFGHFSLNSDKKGFLSFLTLLLGLLGVFVFTFVPIADDTNERNKGDAPRLVIKNNELSNSGFGIYIGPRDEEVLIQGNTITGNAEAIRLTGVKKENLVTDNKILNNLAGITLRDRYSDNKEGYVKYPVDPENIKIKSNEFRNNEAGNIINFLEETSNEGGSTANISSSQSEGADTSSSDTTKSGEGDSKTTSSSETAESSGQADGANDQNNSSESSESESSSKETIATTAGEKGKTEKEDEIEVAEEESDVQNKQVNFEEAPEDAAKKPGESNNNSEYSSEPSPSAEKKVNSGSGNPYVIVGATVVGLTTLLLVLKSSM